MESDSLLVVKKVRGETNFRDPSINVSNFGLPSIYATFIIFLEKQIVLQIT